MNDENAHYNLKTGQVKFDSELVDMLINPRTRKNVALYMPIMETAGLPRRVKRALGRRLFKRKYGKQTRF